MQRPRCSRSSPCPAARSGAQDLGHGLLRAVSANQAAHLDLSDDLEVGGLDERGCVFGRPAGRWSTRVGPSAEAAIDVRAPGDSQSASAYGRSAHRFLAQVGPRPANRTCCASWPSTASG
jgi:hypothetical protein